MQKHLICAALIGFSFHSIARTEEASRVMTVLVAYTYLAKDSNSMEVLRIELFDDQTARVLQYGASGTPYYTNTLTNTNPNVPGLFEKLVREKTIDEAAESDAKWPSLLSVTVSGNNSPPASVSWISDNTRSFIPKGLSGYEELQDFFNKLPVLEKSEIRFCVNNADQYRSGGPPVRIGKPIQNLPKRPLLKPKVPEQTPQSNSTINADF